MPQLNHKGPMGQGAMTGRRMGKCTNYGAGRKSNLSNIVQDHQTSNDGEASVQLQNIPWMGKGFGRRNAINNPTENSQCYGWGRGRGMGFRGGNSPGFGNENGNGQVLPGRGKGFRRREGGNL